MTTTAAINPTTWSAALGFDQAQLVEGASRQLICSGQDAVDEHGAPQHPGDMAAQLQMSLDNLEAVLGAAGMTAADVVRLNVYTTDFDQLLQHWGQVTDRFSGGFATTLLGVSRLPAAELMVMLEATAVD